MERKDFLKKIALGGLSFSLLSGKASQPISICQETPEGEEGPFPTHRPLSVVLHNIKADRVGVALAINISVFDINNQCKPLEGAYIDIWHCDNKGEYSEYGGSSSGMMPPMPPNAEGQGRHRLPPPPSRGGFPRDSSHRPPPPMGMMGGSMQAADHTKEHFLRGRQTTDVKGTVSFESIYPGWYPGRAPHIHAHIFDKTGKSLLISQIAFPDNLSNVIYAQEVYKNHGLPDTNNTTDHVFQDTIANMLATVTGSIEQGYTLHHSVYVKG
jgi:protocatechuate 3,4-dioxygenase beta subunit